jgi:hypothetical protein
MKLVKVLASRQAMRAGYAVLTLMLLAPAPALAFTWISGWQLVASLGTNAPAPTFSSSDGNTSTGGNNGILRVDIPTVAVNGTVAASAIELSRQLQIASGVDKEHITSNVVSQATILNATAKVKVWFTPVVSGSTATPINFSRHTGSNSLDVNVIKTRGNNLKRGSAANNGNYVLHVRVTYYTNGKANRAAGYGDNPKGATAHTFTFAGN